MSVGWLGNKHPSGADSWPTKGRGYEIIAVVDLN